jgi:tRNA-dihydrouridine synthase B
MLGHLRDLYEFYGAEPGVRIARKHIAWYCSGRPHAQAFRQAVMQVLAPERQLELVRTYFDALDEQAGAAAA